jgi:hypothetical protein
MADDVDRTQEQMERDEEARRPRPYRLPPGHPGECDLCGEVSGRLIEGVCAPCRDRWKIR